MKKYYHATTLNNLIPILEEGIKVGCDGIVYLAETRFDALKFIAIRCYDEIITIEIELPENEVEETFDHSETFFKCKSFGYPKDITPDMLGNIMKYPARADLENNK